MAKRVAGHQLTDQNWDDEDDDDVEEEEDASYKIASEEVLSKRVFKKAKRRVTGNQESGEGQKNKPFGVFSGFTGFSSFSSATISSTSSSNTKTVEVKTPPSISLPTAAPIFNTATPIFNTATNNNNKNDFWKQPGAPVFTSQTSGEPVFTSQTSTPESTQENQTTKESESEREKKYSEQITGLNISVLNWIRDHIDKNPLIDLSPVFNDYEKYMREIEEKYGHGSNGKLSGNNETPTSSKQTLDQLKTPENKAVDISPLSSKDNSNPLLSKDMKPNFLSSTPLLQSHSQATNGQKGLSIKDPGFFSAASSLKPFISPESTSNGNIEIKQEPVEKESEEPEKHERTTIEEKDAFYTIRSKLFYKKGSQWQEMGVGMLYLKPLGEKTQLLVRMETTVGKVLLNVCLTASMPITRTGKNNIMLVTVPNPPVFLKPADGDNSKPVTYLIRVKGSIEADELHEKLSENKEKD